MKKTDINNLAEEYIRNKSYEDLTWTEEMHIEDAFKAGFAAKEKLVNKLILDTLNKYRSELSNEETPKLAKTVNYEKTTSYKAYIYILQELQNKLK